LVLGSSDILKQEYLEAEFLTSDGAGKPFFMIKVITDLVSGSCDAGGSGGIACCEFWIKFPQNTDGSSIRV